MLKIDISTPRWPDAFVLVDDEDAHLFEGIKWTPDGSGYAHRKLADGTKEYLHRAIIGAQPGEIVDHANRDRSDDRRANLRIASASDNCRNRAGRGEVAYRGVCKKRNRWRAEIRVDDQSWSLGSYDTSVEAAAAYDDALAYFGLTANGLNLPDREPTPRAPDKRTIAPYGYPGVRQLPSGRFGFRVIVNGKRITGGTFATAEQAVDAARIARKREREHG